VHQISKTGAVQDSETCTSSEAYFGVGTTNLAPGAWLSDFNGVANTGGTVNTVANADGTYTVNILATY
jgi:hypothetical protein